MKRITITIAIVILTAFACKKKKSQYCYWIANGSNNKAYVWEYNKPSDDQVKQFKDTCNCTYVLEEHCQACKTDSSGNDFDCH